ncbi:MAG TPA: metallophosphoesterase [Paludibacter sp.]|nr:metallophosphoesterase [Paludibacter sp.]
MRIGFIIIALTILFSLNGYVIVRGWQALPPASALRPVVLISMLVLFAALLAGIIFANTMPAVMAKAVSFVGFSYMLIFVYLFLSFLLVDIVRITNYFIHFAPAGMASFRLWSLIVTLGVTSISMAVGNYKFNHPQVVTLNLSTERPSQHKKLTIVAVSDIHLGISIDKKDLQKYVKLINDQHPDIVLLAGDASDRSVAPLINQHMDEEFRSIKAPLGVYAISGNHEYYAETPGATADYLRKAGIVFLRDSACLVDNSFYVVGRDDRTNRNRKSLKEIVTGLDDNKPKILLDHQPFHLEEAEQNDIDLQISGHTHNGQSFPGDLLVKGMYELGYGYLKKGKTHYYVSSGLGLWGPQYRIGTQSELVVIRLKY